MAYLDYTGLQRFWEQVKNRLDNKVDKSEVQSDWSVDDATSPSYVKNRTHYDTILSKTLFDGTITATAGTLTRINSIPDEMIVNYPDVSVVRATFDGKACTITATTNKWELRDPNGQLVFTMNYDTAKGAQCLVSTYAGSGAHTLVIEADEITAVPLDEKYIPNTIPRRTDIPKMAMPDWNASEGEAGYVKNRTHYEEKNVIVPNTIIDVSSSDLFSALPILDTAIVAGNSYVVELDNEKYTCVAWANGDVICLGNGNIYPGVNKGEDVPFSIDTYPDKTAFLNTQVGKEYVVSIATPGNIKKLDEKFLPDNLVRSNDLHAVATSGSYNDLTNKPAIPSLNGYATETYVNNKIAGIKHPVDSVNGKTGTVVLTAADVKALPDTTVIPSIDGLASTIYVDNKVAALVDSSPDALNTLNELAAALGDDPNFATTITNQLSEKVDKITGKGLSTNDFTNAEKNRLAEIAANYVSTDDIAGLNEKVTAAHSHATTYKGSAFANGLYKITTNAEGHVTGATAVAKADITALGIPAQDTDTGATSVEVTGAGNAITAASYDATSRKLTLTKGATYTNNEGTVTGVNAGTSLSGGGLGGVLTINHSEGSAVNKVSGLYKIATDATSHVKSLSAVVKEDIVALGIPAQDTIPDYFTIEDIDEITGGCPQPSKAVACYTVRIDTTNSNPLTACEYMDDAVGMEKGSSAWDSMPIFDEIKPCTFVNGAVNYYLDPNNFTLKEDGSAAALDGTDGDVMIEFSKFAYRLYREGDYLYVSITNDPDLVASDSRFQYYAFSRDTVGDVDKMYIGAFKGWKDEEDKFYSIVNGENPTVEISLNQLRQVLSLKGENYSIMNYGQLVALQCLFLIKYGNLDSQAALGRGLTEVNDPVPMGGTIDKGMYYGSTADGLQQMKFAGIEDLWGNVAEWVEGFESDETTSNYLIKYGNQSMIVPSGLTDGYGYGYVSKVLGNTEGGFTGVEFNGDETTYYADSSGFNPSGVLFFGACWWNGADGGLFCLYAWLSADGAYSTIGARLTYL